MRSRILPTTILCVALSFLVACPRTTQAPAASADTAATTDEPPTMGTSDQIPPAETPPEATQGKRAAGQENDPVMAWRAFGNEPFWNARVDGDTLVFTTPDDPTGTTMHGRRVPSLVGFVFVGKDGEADFNLDIRPGECSDGMSDNRYQYVSNFIYDDITYKGCAEAAK
jgi:uncharacterized membrane protein